jgi:hypothetical protein
MTRHRLIRNFQVAAMSLGVIAVASLICGLLWLNQRGFSGQWSATISTELAALGIHADFDEARFSPLRGILVTNAVIYFDESRNKIFAEIPSLKIDVDRGKALRGEVLFRKCQLEDASLTIPLLPEDAGGVDLHLHQLSGQVSVDRQGRLILREATGLLKGMNFTLNAELTNFDPGTLSNRAEEYGDEPRQNFLDALFTELDRWDFPEGRAPTIDLDVRGDLLSTKTLKTSFAIEATELTRRNYTMEDISLRGQFYGRVAQLDHFEFTDGAGQLVAQADYHVLDREGYYRIDSSIHLGRMLRACFDNDVLDGIVTAQAPTVTADGSFRIAPDGSVRVGATGSIELKRFTFLGTTFEGLDTDFSWQNGDIYLRHLHAAHEEGALTGQVLIQSDIIRYEADSSLPVAVFRPFIKPDSALERILSKASFTPASTVQLKANGTIQRSNLKEWDSNGEAFAENFSYNGVPLHSATAGYAITPLESNFTGINIDFDYSKSPLRKKYGGPARARVKADRIAYDHLNQQTELDNIRGTAWPGPVLRLFTPKTGDHIDTTYRFRKPPTFVTNGRIGHRDNISSTDVRTDLKTDGTTNYTLLGRSLSLNGVNADVRYRHLQVDVTDLAFGTFQGRGGGDVSVKIRPGRSAQVSGGIKWTRFRLADIGKTYGFEKATQGFVTGRLDFSTSAGDIGTMDGTGAIGLENGHLFYVPVLGPLSTILGEVAGDKRGTHEEARDASCTFAIRNGVVYTRDFLTSTPSSVFTGEGAIDLDRKTIDMTVRMNARGLLGLITLPLRPFNGLFQFRGQGPLANPTWARANFVPPPDGQSDPIFRIPGRAVVVPEQ